jgi:hypothetical protein
VNITISMTKGDAKPVDCWTHYEPTHDFRVIFAHCLRLGLRSMNNNVPISLNPHLLALLSPLPPLLPPDLRDQLLHHLSFPTDTQPDQPVPTIPYTLLLALSRWARTASPAVVDAARYTPLNLLAGSTTSPNAHLVPPPPYAEGHTRAGERRAVAALANALMSIVGSGVAGWWAAGSAGWQVEWASARFPFSHSLWFY